MGKYPIMVKITLCTDYTEWKEQDEYTLIYADSLSDAARIIEDYYGEDFVKVKFNFLEEAGTLVHFSKEIAKAIEEETNAL